MAARIFLYLLASGLAITPGLAASDSTPFIWWSAAPAERLADGRASQTLSLIVRPDLKLENPTVWCRVTPLYRFNQKGDRSAAFWRRIGWDSPGDWRLTLRSGEYVQVDVFGQALIEGHTHVVQTRLLLYGQSGGSELELSDTTEEPGLPEFQVTSNGEFYWPQTGQEFKLTLRNFDRPAGGGLKVWDGGYELPAELMSADGVFKYTPPRDPALDQAGYAAGKPLVFVARNAEGGTASFTLVVHRSRTAGLDIGAGLAVFTTALALTLSAVAVNRLRIQPCP